MGRIWERERPEGGEPPQRAYGIAEVADRLSVDRRLVAAWRHRGTHAMPLPDAELASGPVWFASTIEPWMAEWPAAEHADPAARRAARVRELSVRLFRLATLLADDPRQT